MKIEKWHRSLRKDARCSVSVPPENDDGAVTYAYARLLETPQGDAEDVLVRLYRETDPMGVEGTIPIGYILLEMSYAQFEAARRCGFPAAARAAMALTNRIYHLGKA